MSRHFELSRIRQGVIIGIVLCLAVTSYSLIRYPGILIPPGVAIIFAGILLASLSGYFILSWRLSQNVDSDNAWSASQGLTWGILIAGFWLLEIVAGNLLSAQYSIVRMIYFGSSAGAFSLPFFGGIFGARYSGLFRTGLRIGAWSGIVSDLLTFLCLMAVTYTFLNRLLLDSQNLLQFQGSGAPDLASFIIGDSLAGATGHLAIGLVLVPAFAAVGAMIGKSIERPKSGSERNL